MVYRSQKKSIFKTWWFWLIIAIVILLIVGLIVFFVLRSRSSNKAKSAPKANLNTKSNQQTPRFVEEARMLIEEKKREEKEDEEERKKKQEEMRKLDSMNTKHIHHPHTKIQQETRQPKIVKSQTLNFTEPLRVKDKQLFELEDDKPMSFIKKRKIKISR